MKVWTCNDHDGHWPVGVASVVVAESEMAARAELDIALRARGLKGYDEEPYTLKPLSTDRPVAVVLCDGNY